MKIKTKSTSPKRLLKMAIIILTAFVVIGACLVLVFKMIDPLKNNQLNTNTTDGGSLDTTNPDQVDIKDEKSNLGSNKTNEDISSSQSGSITIQSFEQKDGSVNVRAETSNFNALKCVYSFTADGGKPVVKEQAGGCSALSIPQNEFDMIGKYTLTVTAYSANEKVTISKEIVVQ